MQYMILENLQRYVSGVNCHPGTAREEMIAVKKRFGKEDGNAAYHGYQSFSPEDKISPDMAHEIGLKLAQELWGDRFQVIIATHLDKAHHIHNHFILNSVSFLDGKKYNDCKATYRQMREASDRLCKQYQLSVIKNPSGRKKHYVEWQAEKQGKPTYRSIMREDIDRAISMAFTDDQFFSIIKSMGYEVKRGEDITLKAQGRRNGLKLARNFGPRYSLEAIRQHILGQEPPKKKTQQQVQVYRLQGILFRQKQTSGLSRTGSLRGLYLHYCYLLGITPKGRRKPSPTLPYSIRSDVVQLDKLVAELRFLSQHKIGTLPELSERYQSIETRIQEMTEKRRCLRNELRWKTLPQSAENIKREISAVSFALSDLRREKKQCEHIAERSGAMKEKLNQIHTGKEMNSDVQRRGRSGTDLPHEPERN